MDIIKRAIVYLLYFVSGKTLPRYPMSQVVLSLFITFFAAFGIANPAFACMGGKPGTRCGGAPKPQTSQVVPTQFDSDEAIQITQVGNVKVYVIDGERRCIFQLKKGENFDVPCSMVCPGVLENPAANTAGKWHHDAVRGCWEPE